MIVFFRIFNKEGWMGNPLNEKTDLNIMLQLQITIKKGICWPTELNDRVVTE